MGGCRTPRCPNPGRYRAGALLSGRGGAISVAQCCVRPIIGDRCGGRIVSGQRETSWVSWKSVRSASAGRRRFFEHSILTLSAERDSDGVFSAGIHAHGKVPCFIEKNFHNAATDCPPRTDQPESSPRGSGTKSTQWRSRARNRDLPLSRCRNCLRRPGLPDSRRSPHQCGANTSVVLSDVRS